MKRFATMFACLLLLGVAAVQAQDTPQHVTVREINQIPQTTIDSLKAAGADLTLSAIDDAIQSAFAGQTVQITAVLMTDPLMSGLRSVDDDGSLPLIGFVRDTSAASQGVAGMGIKISDEAPAVVKLKDSGAGPGSVLTLTGEVIYFSGGDLQFNLTEEVIYEGEYTDFDNLDASILEPVTVTTADINRALDDKVQLNWDNFVNLRGQYVRLENVKVLDRTINDTSSPQMLVSSDNGETYVQIDSRYSTRYNNARITGYPEDFNTREPGNPFVPPAPGSVINLQGTLYYGSSSFEAFDFGAVPAGAWMQIAPWTDAGPNPDLEVLESATITRVTLTPVEGIPGEDPVTVTVEVEAAPGAVADAVLVYETSTQVGEQTVPLTTTDEVTYTAEIPAQEDGALVTYYARLTDTEGKTFESDETAFRVLYGGINAIADIQETPDGDFGDSPFAGVVLPMDLTATVQNDPSTSGLLVLQDAADLAPWSGIYVFPTEEMIANLKPGDVIHITEAEVEERFDVTQLTDVTYTKTGTGTPLPYKVVTTADLQSDAVAEAHEGMLVRFEDVVITSTNADGPDANHGEWAFATAGTDASVRADDASEGIPFDFNDGLTEGQELDFIQGVWYYSFGNYKLLPFTVQDVGGIDTATEAEGLPGTYVLDQNYPNPFNPETTIRYTVPQAGPVRLAVYDVLGREVALLADRTVAAGTYTVRFDGTGLASGLYLYRLEGAGNTVLMRTMLLMK